MATCKVNCLHYEACKATYKELTGGIGTGGNAEYCKYFKDRSKFIELPCKVGDTVWMWDYKKEIYSSEIEEIMVDCRGFMFDAGVIFRDRHIGERVFLSKEEAEQALKERDNVSLYENSPKFPCCR